MRGKMRRISVQIHLFTIVLSTVLNCLTTVSIENIAITIGRIGMYAKIAAEKTEHYKKIALVYVYSLDFAIFKYYNIIIYHPENVKMLLDSIVCIRFTF